MRLLRRAEVGLDAKMNLQLSLLEPDAAALGETRWFGLLGQSKDADIERPRRFLSVRWHCQLHMFNCVDFYFHMSRSQVLASLSVNLSDKIGSLQNTQEQVAKTES